MGMSEIVLLSLKMVIRLIIFFSLYRGFCIESSLKFSIYNMMGIIEKLIDLFVEYIGI